MLSWAQLQSARGLYVSQDTCKDLHLTALVQVQDGPPQLGLYRRGKLWELSDGSDLGQSLEPKHLVL